MNPMRFTPSAPRESTKPLWSFMATNSLFRNKMHKTLHFYLKIPKNCPSQTSHAAGEGDCVPQRAEHASWRGHTAPLVTEHSQLPAPDYGTVFHRTWKTLTCHTVNSGGR